ncbi:Arrestin-related trafficking adapter 5 [Lachancea thermotolerans]
MSMFSLGKLSSSSTQPIYFDVRLKSSYKNIVLIQGTPLEASPIPISGHIVFSVPETISVKKIALKLAGTFKLEFLQVGHHKNSSVASIVKERRTIFECVWDNLLVSPIGRITVGDPSHCESQPELPSGATPRPHLIQSLSTPTINNLWKPKKSNSAIGLDKSSDKSFTSLFDGISTGPGHTFVIQKGNYELPFKVSLPPNIAETIEGLQAGSVLYKFESQMDRGGFKNAFTKHKYVRIFRTLSPNNLAVGEEMSVGKSWPDRLQYEISIPSRAIPVGGVTPVTVSLYPFQKGYKLYKIEVSLIQYYAFKDQNEQMYDDENIVFHKVVKDFKDLSGCDGSVDNTIVDKVVLNSSVHLPANLKQVTQDCDIGGDAIRVRHKLSIKITLKKRVGEEDKKTEIKANIPVFLYISPHVPVEGRLVLLDNTGKVHFRSGEGVPLFEKQILNTTLASSTSLNNLQRSDDGSLSVNYFPEEDTEAPPTYAKHVYDQVFDADNDISQLEALRSTSTTPLAKCTLRAPLDSQIRSLSLENLNRVPSYEQVVDDVEDEPALPICELTPSYEVSNPLSQPCSMPNSAENSRPTSPEPANIASRKSQGTLHGGLAHFVRAQIPDRAKSPVHSRQAQDSSSHTAGSHLHNLLGHSKSGDKVPSSHKP